MRPNADFYYECGCGRIWEWTLTELKAAGPIVSCDCGRVIQLHPFEDAGEPVPELETEWGSGKTGIA